MKGEVYGVHSLATLQNFTCFVSFVKGDFRLWMFPFHFKIKSLDLRTIVSTPFLLPVPCYTSFFRIGCHQSAATTQWNTWNRSPVLQAPSRCQNWWIISQDHGWQDQVSGASWSIWLEVFWIDLPTQFLYTYSTNLVRISCHPFGKNPAKSCNEGNASNRLKACCVLDIWVAPLWARKNAILEINKLKGHGVICTSNSMEASIFQLQMMHI